MSSSSSSSSILLMLLSCFPFSKFRVLSLDFEFWFVDFNGLFFFLFLEGFVFLSKNKLS
jgi:hypothetical protein